MTRMVRMDRWLWGDLARSLNLAGITYAGDQWTASLLGDKVATLRWKRRRRERAAAPQHALSVELLREALGSLGSINQLVINVQAAPPGTAVATLGAHDFREQRRSAVWREALYRTVIEVGRVKAAFGVERDAARAAQAGVCEN